MSPGPSRWSRSWVARGLLLAVVAAIAAGGVAFRRSLARDQRARAVEQLDAIAGLKAHQIAEWRRDLVGEVEAVASNPLLARLAGPGAAGVGAPRGVDAAAVAGTDDLAVWLASLARHLQHRAIIVLGTDLRPLLTVPRQAGSPDSAGRALAADALQRNATVVSELTRQRDSRERDLWIAAPIRPRSGARPEGIVLVRVDLERGLLPAVARQAGSFATGETILVGRAGDTAEVLAHVRHRDRAHLPAVDPGLMPCLVQAVVNPGGAGRRGVHDHHGVPVIAVARVVDDSPWVLVATAEAAEVDAGTALPSRLVALLTGLAALLVVVAAALLRYRRRASKYRRHLDEQAEHLVLLKRTEYLMRHATDAIFLATDDGRLLEANERAVAMYGHTRDELLAMHSRDLRAPEAAGTFERQWRRADERGGRIYETAHRRKDGTTFPVEISVRVIEVGGQRLRQAIMRDVSERRGLEARLRLSERLASVGTLAGGVAHEINNPLACVIANVDFALEELADAPGAAGAELRAALAEGRQAAGRVRDIVRTLGAMVGQGLDGGGGVDLRRVVTAAAAATLPDVQGRARLVLDVCEVPPVPGAEAPLTQVFVSLIVNAAQAIPPGHPADHEVAVAMRRDAAGRVLVEVRDTGCGMSPEVMARIFDPFYSTRGVGAGMGLGLALCHGVVTNLGGEIHVESTVGKGSVFRVVLPVAEAADGAATAAVTPLASARPAA